MNWRSLLMNKQEHAMRMVNEYLNKIADGRIQISDKRDTANGFHTVDTFCDFIQNKVDYSEPLNSDLDGLTQGQKICRNSLQSMDELVGYIRRNPDLYPQYFHRFIDEAEKGMNAITSN